MCRLQLSSSFVFNSQINYKTSQIINKRMLQGLCLCGFDPELHELREPGHAEGIHQEVRPQGTQQEPYQASQGEVIIFYLTYFFLLKI